MLMQKNGSTENKYFKTFHQEVFKVQIIMNNVAGMRLA